MAKYLNGINGPITGTIGNVVGSSYEGVPQLKGKYKKRTKNVTQKELDNRVKFGLSQAWLQPVLPFVREGFKKEEKKGRSFVNAKSYVSKNALEGIVPALSINPALVKVSRGDLPVSGNIAAAQTADGKLQFTWDTAAVEGGSPYDQAMLLAYDIEHGIAAYNMTGQFRSTGADTLKIMAEKGRTWHLYIAFSAADRKKQSDSVYLGTIGN
jgi:hypothetical protein